MTDIKELRKLTFIFIRSSKKELLYKLYILYDNNKIEFSAENVFIPDVTPDHIENNTFYYAYINSFYADNDENELDKVTINYPYGTKKKYKQYIDDFITLLMSYNKNNNDNTKIFNVKNLSRLENLSEPFIGNSYRPDENTEYAKTSHIFTIKDKLFKNNTINTNILNILNSSKDYYTVEEVKSAIKTVINDNPYDYASTISTRSRAPMFSQSYSELPPSYNSIVDTLKTSKTPPPSYNNSIMDTLKTTSKTQSYSSVIRTLKTLKKNTKK